MKSRRRKYARSGKTVSRRRSGEPSWAALPDDELLTWRMCDLGLHIEGTVLEERIERLYDELEYRGIRFRPHFWLSDEWFSPDGVPGIAIPFYLAHPRLARLERKQMLEVEGGTEDWCLRILRHEAGHALRHRLSACIAASITASSSAITRRPIRTLSSQAVQQELRAEPRAVLCAGAIRPRILPKPLPCGSSRARLGGPTTKTGRSSRSSNMWPS